MFTNRQIWNISYPILLSLLAQNIINVTDTAFLGRVGEVELGASALGGLFYICAYTIAFGFSIGSQILMARRNGEKEYSRLGDVMMQGVFFLLGLAAVMFMFVRLGSSPMLKLLITSEEIREATVSFLHIRVFGFFFSFINVIFRAFFVAITRTKALTYNAILMAGVNTLLDYLLIFGHAGFPVMGLEGAAISSVIAEGVSIIFFIFYTRFTVDAKRFGLNRIHTPNLGMLKSILSISIFTMLQQFITMGTFFFFFVVVEHIGQRELAIANIVRSIYIVLFIPINALSTTTNTLVSNAIGAGQTVQVIPIIKRIAIISFFAMLIFSSFFCIFPETFISIYTNEAALIAGSIPSIYVISAAILFCALGGIAFNGVSGTGNTRDALIIELITLFFNCLYIYIIGVVLKMPVHICFTSEIVYFGLMLILCVVYLRRGKWRNKAI